MERSRSGSAVPAGRSMIRADPGPSDESLGCYQMSLRDRRLDGRNVHGGGMSKGQMSKEGRSTTHDNADG
jgi:hypothetical protein